MPTYGTSRLPAASPSGPRHSAPDRVRVGTLLTVSWATLHVAAISVLGIAVHQADTSHSAPIGASAPDQPYV
jgi:hypothetical protein